MKKPVNFSHLARKAGFRSRSFIKEVVSGKKGLAPRSMTGVSQALDFRSIVKTHFENLVKLSEPACNTENLNREKLLQKLDQSRNKIRARSAGAGITDKQAQDVFFSWTVPIVYAALGSIEAGSSLKEVQRRTRMSEHDISKVLDTLVRLKIIQLKNGRYYAIGSVSDLQELGANEQFHSTYLAALEKLSLRSQKGLSSHSELFSYTALSVDSSRLPEMKNALRKMLEEFMDEYQVDEGDQITKLIVGMFL